MNLVIALGTLLLTFLTFSVSEAARPPFYSPAAHQAILNYQFRVQIETTTQPTVNEWTEAVEKQITFLFGAFSNNPRSGVPKVEQKYSINSVKQLGTALWEAQYSYSGEILVSNGSQIYEFYLPLTPLTVYQKGLVESGGSVRTPCTDTRLNMERYFWYFFNPKATGCPLREKKDYDLVQGSLVSKPNTRETYPEYERLIQDQQISMSVIYGMDNGATSWNPLDSKDINAMNYREARNDFLRAGYQSLVWTPAQLKTYFGSQMSQYPFVEEMTKRTPRALLKVRLFFGPTSIYDGQSFQRFFVNELRQTSVIIYAGHSGLGDYLSLKTLSSHGQVKIEMPKDRYQILFFNSCSSYPYYNAEYFSLKRSPQDPLGTKQLDIITNGLSTLFMAIGESNRALISSIDRWASSGVRTSYQQMMKAADSYNLIGINGDEDN